MVFTLLFLLVAAALCILCGRADEPKDDPCGTCVRWEECNGVDEDCPWKEETRGET